MGQLNGTNVSAAIVPNDSRDVFATHLAAYGDYDQHVETLEERDAIPINPGYLNEDQRGSGRRSLGMTVTIGGLNPEEWVQYRLEIPSFFTMDVDTKLLALASNIYWKLLDNTIYGIDGGNANESSFTHPSLPNF